MYLISLYFDDKTNKTIKRYIEQVAKITGNTYMLDGNVPPHITISALETKDEEKLVEVLEREIGTIQKGSLQWVAVGAFMPYVLYIAPVQNEYLHNVSFRIYEGLKDLNNTSVSNYYRPFQWFPHVTLGKKLTKEQMTMAFELMQNQFMIFQGTVTKIGIAKTNPYIDIKIYNLKDL